MKHELDIYLEAKGRQYRELNERELDKFIERVIERYKKFDGAHDDQHARMVIKNSEYIAANMMKDEKIELDMRMVKVIAAMHDLGLEYDRETHHTKSGEIVRKTKELRKFFSEEQIELIAKSVEEHRASYKGEYTSVYSKIVSDADRMNDINTMIARTYKWNKKHYPDLNDEDIYKEVISHLQDKFGEKGYARFNTKYAEDVLNQSRKIIMNNEEFDKIYKDMYGMPWI
jgi:uncharacterized protein